MALPCIHSLRRNFPLDTGAHLAIRESAQSCAASSLFYKPDFACLTLSAFYPGTIRRFLEECKPESIEKLVLVVTRQSSAGKKFGRAPLSIHSLPRRPPLSFSVCPSTLSAEEEAVYLKLLPLYFPRSIEEERDAAKKLPDDIGALMGGHEFQGSLTLTLPPFPPMHNVSFLCRQRQRGTSHPGAPNQNIRQFAHQIRFASPFPSSSPAVFRLSRGFSLTLFFFFTL